MATDKNLKQNEQDHGSISVIFLVLRIGAHTNCMWNVLIEVVTHYARNSC